MNKEIEKALEYLINRYMIIEGFAGYKEINAVKQYITNQEREIKLLKRDLDSRDLMRKLTVGKLQSKLDIQSANLKTLIKDSTKLINDNLFLQRELSKLDKIKEIVYYELEPTTKLVQDSKMDILKDMRKILEEK